MPSSEFHASLRAKGSGAKDWGNSCTEVEYLGGGKFTAHITIGPRVFKDKTDGRWKAHKLTDERLTKDYVLIQSAKCCVEIHPYYATYYDVHHEEVRVHEERWVVQRLFKEPDTWRDVGAYNPTISIEESFDAIKVTITYDTDYGPFVLEYLQRDENSLKHNVAFTNISGGNETFRVLQRWAGIAGEKCNKKTIPLSENSARLVFQRGDEPNEDKFIISESLHSMIYTEETDPKSGERIERADQCLQRPVLIEGHPKGMKADFIYAQWVLTDGEKLEIDPTTDTFQPPSLDGYIEYMNGTFDEADSSETEFRYGEDKTANYHWYRAYLRFDVTALPDGAVVSEAIFSIWKFGYSYDGSPEGNMMLAEVEDIGTSLTSADWARAVVIDHGIFIALADRGDDDIWVNLSVVESITGLDTFVSFRIKDSIEDSDSNAWKAYGRSAEHATTTTRPKLVVTYTVPVAPTVTTQAATGLTIGAGTLHGTITDTGGENADERGFDWDYDTGAPYAYEETDLGDFGVGAFEEVMSGFTEGNTVYFRGKANNSAGWGYGGELNFVVRKAVSRSASATVGLAGTAKRAFVGERIAAGAIGITGISGRGFVGTRSAVASLSVVATAAREQVLERVASAALSLVGTTGRTLHAIRSAGAATSIVAVASRTLHIFRSASAAVAVVGTATRSWIGTRVASAALGIIAVGTSIKVFVRTASASMSVVGTAARSWVGSRSASAELSLIGTPGRILSAFRSAAASFSLVGTADRMLSAFRSASATLDIVGISGRTLHAIRSAVANVGIVGTALRSWVGSRSAPATMAITATSDRMLHSIRSASASMSQVATAVRSGVFTRSASGDLTIQGTPSRVLRAFRSAVAAISTVATAARSQVLVRTQSASIGITAVSGRRLAAIRKAAASMSITAVGGFFRRVIRGTFTTRLGGKESSLGFGGQIVVLKEGEKEVEGEVSKKDG